MRGQGCIYQRGGAWWIAYYHRGEQIRESVRKARENTKQENREAAAKRLLKLRQKTANTPGFVGPAVERLTVAELADLVLTDYRLNERRSLVDVARHVRQLKSAFGGDRAMDLTSDRITAYAAQRRFEGYAPASVNQELQVIRRMFTLAIQAGKLTPAHRPHIARLAVENAREGFLEPATFAALRVALPDWLADAAAFGYLTGWRKSEIATLTWADVTLTATGGRVRLRAAHSKKKKPRIVPLTGDLRALLERRKSFRRLDCPLVFYRGAGEPLGDFRKVWISSCAAAHVPGLLFHDLRRSAVRNMVRAGVPERVAMALSGHQTRSVFDRYNIVSEDELEAATARTANYVAEQERQSATVVALVGAHPAKERAQNEHSRARFGASD
jgi:integrase